MLAEQTQWDGGHHPCIRKPGGSRTIRSIPSSRCQTSPRAQRARANSSTLPRNAAGTGCLDPLVRAGKRKCARPKNDSGAEGTGGARRDRTDDLMLAKHALSQLSYGPIGVRRFASARPMFKLASSAGDRIRDLGCRAIRRDARSGFGLVEGVRVLPSSKAQPKWWAWEDLNFRPHAYQARALTN